MKLQRAIGGVILLASVFMLGACSTLYRHGNNAHGRGGNAQTAGLGSSPDYDETNSNNNKLAQKRTYYFEFDRSEIQDSDKPAIIANADFLIEHPDTKIRLEGHTDPRGSREYNVALGERRANAVLAFLRARGVNPRQVRVVSYGSERPAVEGRTEWDFQRDRRAIIVVERG